MFRLLLLALDRESASPNVVGIGSRWSNDEAESRMCPFSIAQSGDEIRRHEPATVLSLLHELVPYWTLQARELEGATGLAEGMGNVFVHGRRAGQTLALRARRGAHIAETTILLGAGITEVLLTLPAEPPAAPAADVDSDDADSDDADSDEVDLNVAVGHASPGEVVLDRVIIRH
jgi:hypothetical protein